MDRTVAVGATAILAVGLPEVRRAEAKEISHPATKVFVFDVEEFFASQQAAFRLESFSSRFRSSL
jgi:hypothetical protein